MKWLQKINSAWWLFIVVGIVYYAAGTHAAMLCFVLFWQIVSIRGIIKSVQSLQKSRRGVYAEGKLVRYDKLPNAEESTFTYIGIIEFYWPTNESSHQIEHGLRFIDENKQYTIWVNTNSPEKSIVVDQFGRSWWGTLIVFVLITLGLFVVDYFLIKQILN